MFFESTVAAVCTPPAAGGIAAVRVSGPQAINAAEKVFSPVHRRLCELAGYTAAYGRFFDGQSEFDDGVALVYRAPHSYTGEDTVELFCHGGVYVAQRLLTAVIAAGARLADPGEFTKRAFLNGKMDLTQAESVMAKVSAEGDAALSEAALAAEGRTSAEISDIKAELLAAAAGISAYIEYPDDDIEPPRTAEALQAASDRIGELIKNFDNGEVYRGGVSTVILGRPNVGKSAIMNLLSGCERSIVTPVAGTTRDIIEDTVRLDGLLLRLSDTAGIRGDGDEIEKIGIGRAKKRLEAARLVLAVFDGGQPLDEGDHEVMELCRGKCCVCVINKSDLPQRVDREVMKPYFEHTVLFSALAGDTAPLSAAIREALGANITAGPPIFTQRQRDCLSRAKNQLDTAAADCRGGLTLDAVSIGIEQAVSILGELTGENASQQIIDEVFKRFCVGK